jgi:hypothetical protein
MQEVAVPDVKQFRYCLQIGISLVAKSHGMALKSLVLNVNVLIAGSVADGDTTPRVAELCQEVAPPRGDPRRAGTLHFRIIRSPKPNSAVAGSAQAGFPDGR